VEQEISVHGSEQATVSNRSQGEDTGYSEDAGYGQIFEDKKSMSG
jgi:hypothetical protein